MPYDAFISYRRSNGFLMAQVIHDRLKEQGINCFLDLEELTSGKFDDKILETIRSAPNFILVLPPGTLDRCVDEDDWVRREILAAVQYERNIIPVMYDGFEWPRQWDDRIPQAIRSLEYQNAVPGTQAYLPAMIEKIIKYLHDIPKKRVNPERDAFSGEAPPITETLHIATSNLTVVDTFMQGWECESLFRKYGLNVEKHPYKWSDKVLKDLASGKLDVAVYNKKSCQNYNREHEAGICILRDVCSSMGGRNFYILASKNGRWTDMTLEQFKQNMDSNTIIGVSKASDMYKNLLYILDMSEQELQSRGVKIMDYHSDQGLDIFNFMPDLLVIAGQDIRYLAEWTGDFFEIISYDDFPQDKRQFFYENSVNSLLIGPKGLEKMSGLDIEQVGLELELNFYRNALQPKPLEKIRENLSRQLNNICDDDDAIEYIVKQIIFETYRFM